MQSQKRIVKYELVVVFLILLLSGCSKQEKTVLTEELNPAEETSAVQIEEKDAAKEPQSAVVYLCGAVVTPGVYELPAGSRLHEALAKAGGLTEQAADTYLNQAEEILDGQRIYVPTKEEAQDMAQQEMKQPDAAAADSGQASGKVNLNTASAQELMTLTGIGEAKALSIIEYREANGRFQSIEEIKQIPGIKDGVFQKIKDHISI